MFLRQAQTALAAVPDSILQKQGPLDGQEWQLMRQHPVVGEHIIAGIPDLSHLAPAMRAEHEHWDGSGYPDGLIGDQIPLASRITLACDALNAMTSDRPYRSAMTLERAQQELRSCAGTQFDPQTIKALLAEIEVPSIARSGGRPPPGTGADQAAHPIDGTHLNATGVAGSRLASRAPTGRNG